MGLHAHLHLPFSCVFPRTEALANWSKFQQFWWVFEQLAARSHVARTLLCGQQAVARLLHAFYGARSTLPSDVVGPLCLDVGNQMVAPEFGPLLSCVAMLVAHGNTRGALRAGVRLEPMVRRVSPRGLWGWEGAGLWGLGRGWPVGAEKVLGDVPRGVWQLCACKCFPGGCAQCRGGATSCVNKAGCWPCGGGQPLQ